MGKWEVKTAAVYYSSNEKQLRIADKLLLPRFAINPLWLGVDTDKAVLDQRTTGRVAPVEEDTFSRAKRKHTREMWWKYENF